MGKKLALPNQPPFDMDAVCDLLDMVEERIAQKPPIIDVVEDEGPEREQEVEKVADDDFDYGVTAIVAPYATLIRTE